MQPLSLCGISGVCVCVCVCVCVRERERERERHTHTHTHTHTVREAERDRDCDLYGGLTFLSLPPWTSIPIRVYCPTHSAKRTDTQAQRKSLALSLSLSLSGSAQLAVSCRCQRQAAERAKLAPRKPSTKNTHKWRGCRGDLWEAGFPRCARPAR